MNRKLFVGIAAFALAVSVTCSSVFADINTFSFSKKLLSAGNERSISKSSSAADDSAFSALSAAKGGETIYEFEKQGYKNCLDYILARDGFVYGMDYNGTLDVLQLSSCMGDNTILGKTATYSESACERDFYNIRALGFNCTSWWLMSDGQGMLFDDDGLATGVQDKFMKNLRHMLSTARKVGIAVNPCIIPHGMAGNYGLGNGKETPNEILNKYFRYMWEEEALDALIKNVVEPVCKVMSEYPDVIAAVSLNIENSTEMLDDYDKGLFQYGQSGTTLENYASYLNALNAAVKKYMPNIPTAMEQAGGADSMDADERMYYQNFVNIDLICENVYHSGGWVEPTVRGYNTRPGFIGEYNTGETNRSEITDAYQASKIYNFNRTAKQNGWLGAFYYSYFSGGSDFSVTNGNNTSDYDKFTNWAIGFRYEIDDEIAEFKGSANEKLAKANMLYYNGGDYVYWIPPRGSEKSTIQRSSDSGKTWHTVVENIDSDIMLNNGLMKYKLTDSKDGEKYMFRIISYSGDGVSTVSEPSNEAQFFIPKNICLNSGFETNQFVKNGINGWSGDTAFSFSNECVFEGKYSLKMNANNYGYATAYQVIKVEPNTIYQLDFKWYCDQFEFSDDRDYNEPLSVIVEPVGNGSKLGYSYFESSKGDWSQRTILFNTLENTEVRIKILSGTSNVKAVAYFDDFSLKIDR